MRGPDRGWSDPEPGSETTFGDYLTASAFLGAAIALFVSAFARASQGETVMSLFLAAAGVFCAYAAIGEVYL